MKLAFADMSLTLSCIFISSMDCFYRITLLPRLILCSAEKWRKAIIYYCYHVLYMWPDLVKWVVSRSLINDARALFRPLFQLFLISTSVFIFIGLLSIPKMVWHRNRCKPTCWFKKNIYIILISFIHKLVLFVFFLNIYVILISFIHKLVIFVYMLPW